MAQRDKPTSWQWIISFYEKMIQQQGQRYLPLLELVKTLALSEHASTFRAGQSLDALIISTTSYHGLQEDDPHIVINVVQSTDLFVIEYWNGDNENDLLVSSTCQGSELLSHLLPLLRRLREDTLGKDEV